MAHDPFLLNLSDWVGRPSGDGDDRKFGVNSPGDGDEKEALEARGFEIEDETIKRPSQEGLHYFHPPAADRNTKGSLARPGAQGGDQRIVSGADENVARH
jgi:hypothetical protein